MEAQMDIVQVAGIIFAAAVVLILAYLYRESAQISGKAKVEVGPVKVEFEGDAQKEASQTAGAPGPSIEQSATDLGRIEDSAPEIHGDTGDIKQTASGDGPIAGSGPKIS
jgi:hypothetical protein